MSSLLDMVKNKRATLQRGNNNRPEKLQSGKNLVRIFPSWDGTEEGPFSQDWGQHFIKDQTGALKAVYICSQTNFGEECAICNAISEGMAVTSDDDLLKTLKDARSNKRILVNALYLKGGKHEDPEKNVVVLELPPSVFDKILATFETFYAEGLNVFSLTEGHNFVIEKTGAGMNTEYNVTPSPRASAVDKSLLSKAKDLSEWVRQESEVEKAKALTSVRVIAGTTSSGSAPRLAAPTARPASRLSEVSADDAIDADFEEVPVSTKPKVSSTTDDGDLEDFLNDL